MKPAGIGGVGCALLFVFLWSSSFVPSRIAALEAPPLWFLIGRFFIGALVFTGIALALRLRFPSTPQRWGALAAIGVFAHATYLGLSYEALRHLSSAMGAIIACTNPLILALIAPRLLGERLTALKCLGLALGFGGVLLVTLERAGSGVARPQDVFLAFAGVVAFVVSTTLFKRMENRESIVVINAIGFATATLTLIPIATVLEGAPHATMSPALIGSFLYLVIFLTLGSTVLWFWLLSHGEATRVSAYYFLAPMFGIAMGAAFLHEQVFPRDALGLACVVAGLIFVNH